MEHSDKPFIIGIAGGSGAGKTTLVRVLKDSFSAEEVCVISQDDYYLPRDKQLTDDQGVKNFDLPTSIDKKAFKEDLKKLMLGKKVERLEYTFNNERATPKTLTFMPTPVIIVEGLFIMHFKSIRKRLDLKVFVQAKENLKVIRRILRDKTERNYPLDDVLYRYQHHVLPTYEKYISPYVSMADIIINNNTGMKMGIDVMKAVIKDKLFLKEVNSDMNLSEKINKPDQINVVDERGEKDLP